VLIPPDVPDGTYTLAVGLYPLAAPSDRLPVVLDGAPAGDRLNLAPVVVTRGASSTGKE
jgi:hypothetical protein